MELLRIRNAAGGQKVRYPEVCRLPITPRPCPRWSFASLQIHLPRLSVGPPSYLRPPPPPHFSSLPQWQRATAGPAPGLYPGFLPCAGAAVSLPFGPGGTLAEGCWRKEALVGARDVFEGQREIAGGQSRYPQPPPPHAHLPSWPTPPVLLTHVCCA